MQDHRIARIEWARLTGQRPREARCNARLGVHGQIVSSPIARITTDQGATGFGWALIGREAAERMVGMSLSDAVDMRRGVSDALASIEFPLLDLAGKLAGQPVYALIGGGAFAERHRVRCYDTSLYIDDLHIAEDDEAAALIASEAAEGLALGHRWFKIKVGRGAMHMPLERGTQRDIAVVKAVRQAVGPDARIMLDANNGFNLNITKRVLGETAQDQVYWMEEPFHEDNKLYENLKAWLARENLSTLIADGEGDASSRVVDWAHQGLIDVVQYDSRRPGFSFWMKLGPQLDHWGVRSAPHNYGEPFGNYVSGHLAGIIERFECVEWDAADMPGLDASAYVVSDGWLALPNLPGFGLGLDEAIFGAAIAANGFVVQA